MKNCKLFILLFLFFPFFGWTQCEEIYLTGKTVDTLKTDNFYNLMVVNLSTKQGVYGRPNGEFSVYVKPGNKIAFSVDGYKKTYLQLPESMEEEKCSIDTLIFISPKVQEYAGVNVYPIKSLQQIKEERDAISKRETRTVTGINVLESPITALYERFSRKAKDRKWVAEMEHKDNMNQIVKELLRVYVSYDVIYLDEEEFTDFIYFLNIDESFLKTASDYDLAIYIQGKLEHYKQLNPEIFAE